MRLLGGDSLELTRTLTEPAPPPVNWPCTAVVVPVYNEDPVRVFAGIKATYESLEQTGFLPFFEFFILSDTTDPNTWIREEMAFTELRRSVSNPAACFIETAAKTWIARPETSRSSAKAGADATGI